MSSLHSVPIRTLREQYMLSTFVETGCNEGDGIACALDAGFAEVFSCDISPEFVARCQRRFQGVPNVTILVGDSRSSLETLLQKTLGPALFWLDAHFPAHYHLDEKLATRFPLLEEVALIAHSKRELDVVLCDDMRVIRHPANPRWREGELSPYYVIDNVSYPELLGTLEKTHCAELIMVQEGVLCFTPRNRSEEATHALL